MVSALKDLSFMTEYFSVAYSLDQTFNVAEGSMSPSITPEGSRLVYEAQGRLCMAYLGQFPRGEKGRGLE